MFSKLGHLDRGGGGGTVMQIKKISLAGQIDLFIIIYAMKLRRAIFKVPRAIFGLRVAILKAQKSAARLM